MHTVSKLGAFAAIFNDQGRVLLCHRRDQDLWNLPGGGVEPGELPEAAVLREIQEEIGCTAQIKSLTGIYHKPEQNELVFQYIAEITEGMPGLSDECDAIEYFDITALPANTAPRQIQRIQDAAAFASNIFFRVQ
jgi:8-oxo-dGTP diphosphatase